MDKNVKIVSCYFLKHPIILIIKFSIKSPRVVMDVELRLAGGWLPFRLKVLSKLQRTTVRTMRNKTFSFALLVRADSMFIQISFSISFYVYLFVDTFVLRHLLV